jgi:GH43 family beta-xylosidase
MSMAEYLNPIVIQRADPFVYRHSDGFYYFTGSHPLYDRIVLRRAKSLNELHDAPEYVVWAKHLDGPMSQLIWAPEIHRINGKWYIYFAAAPNELIEDDSFNHRMFVIENDSDNPCKGEWVEKGEVKTGWSTFSLDATTFVHKGYQYYVWAQPKWRIHGHYLLVRSCFPNLNYHGKSKVSG